jgi:hypothetical protein
MLRIAALAFGALLIWCVATAALVGIRAATNKLWSAEVAYLVVAATLVTAWEATHILLRRGNADLPYRPR